MFFVLHSLRRKDLQSQKVLKRGCTKANKFMIKRIVFSFVSMHFVHVESWSFFFHTYIKILKGVGFLYAVYVLT